ncbi:MAG: ThuA domain-containing protein [Acidimicrobiia bacterium]|nr:ThuA domain-containing protein [Acidimicrobiia bacterium]
MRRVLVLVGGSPHAHDFGAVGRVLVDIARTEGHDVTLVDHPDAAAESLWAPDPIGRPELLVVHGLWWRMDGPAYDRWRPDHGYTTSPEWRDAVSDHVAGGGPLLALHTAPICFDDWPEWGNIVGGAWQWGISSHPPLGPVTAMVVDGHPVTAGLPPELRLRDEVYGDLAVRDGIDVLLRARRHPDDDLQPIGWVHRFGRGRVVYDGLGHDARSLTDPAHRRLITQAMGWLLETGGRLPTGQKSSGASRSNEEGSVAES